MESVVNSSAAAKTLILLLNSLNILSAKTGALHFGADEATANEVK